MCKSFSKKHMYFYSVFALHPIPLLANPTKNAIYSLCFVIYRALSTHTKSLSSPSRLGIFDAPS